MYGEGGGSSRLGQIPNFYRKFVLEAPLTKKSMYIEEHNTPGPIHLG